MRPLVLLWGCLVLPGYGALTGPKKIRGFEGGTVSLLCAYKEQLRGHQKYWCRNVGFLIDRCSATVYTRADGRESTEGRVSIRDKPWELRFNVTLRALTLEDSGDYLCGVKRLGFDVTFGVSLVVLPGPCCAPSPAPFLQPLATSFQPKARAWQTQPPARTFPGVHPRVTTAKRGKTKAEASLLTGTSPSEHTGATLYSGTSPHTGTPPRAGTPPYEETSPYKETSPYEETSPHKATSPHAGTAGPSTHPDFISANDASLHRSSSSSSSSAKSRVCPVTVRMLAPVLVLLALLLISGLCALGRCIFQWRKKVQLAKETQKNEKVHHSHSTSEQEEAPSQHPEGEVRPGPPLHMSEELKRSVFVSV
ncbi:CD300 molecule like family member g [Phyllostomus discolor]|uniref:CD300 molecule like family member g n=1 Tax=Phyllostomus discolor TaxID=89673 RepID=A0A7E6EEX5_9CHIR|nr:CMRF35-like molecule 9 isoform X3 [Phyllostomus discolor]KAF6092818.1 CD300 molecule like family member g [Phyllostomus discolor]